VIDRGISADLVVLASCSTADPGTRDELRPLAHAFLATGSHAVVASRWTVLDELALRFSRAFYASAGAADPVRGTARALQILIREGVPASSWSTFVVYGELASPKTAR